MRYILLITCALAFIGCGTTVDNLPKTQETVAFDFSPYSDKGFLITPQKYNGEYQAIGQITITLSPKAEKQSSAARAQQMSRAEQRMRAEGQWVVYGLETSQLVEAMYQEAKAMGADAVTSFSVTPQARNISPSLTLTTYEIRGFAIDRE